MVLGELCVALHHFRGGLANDDEAHDDGLLGALVLREIIPGQPFYKVDPVKPSTATVSDGQKDVYSDHETVVPKAPTFVSQVTR